MIADRELDYCGCCAEQRPECVCSLGPCDSFNEFQKRMAEKNCVHPSSAITLPPHEVEL